MKKKTKLLKKKYFIKETVNQTQTKELEVVKMRRRKRRRRKKRRRKEKTRKEGKK